MEWVRRLRPCRRARLDSIKERSAIRTRRATSSSFSPADTAPDTGGLVGTNTGSISQSYASVNITESSTGGGLYVGGLVGWNAGGTVSQSYATGAVTNTLDQSAVVGGLIGENDGTVSSKLLDRRGKWPWQRRGPDRRQQRDRYIVLLGHADQRSKRERRRRAADDRAIPVRSAERVRRDRLGERLEPRQRLSLSAVAIAQ